MLKFKNFYYIVISIVSLLVFGCKSIPKYHEVNNQQLCKIHSSVCLNNCCPDNANDIVIDHGIFILAANCDTRFSDWVAYKVESKNLGGPKRKRVWRKDKDIPAQCTLSPKDYKGAYDDLALI